MSVPLKLKRVEPSEAAILDGIRRALRVHPHVVWAERMNTGSGKLQHASGTSRYIKFGFKGCPDIIGQMVDGRLLAIEVKRPSGRVRPEQREFIDKASAHGALAIIARSVSDVWTALGNAP
jgi:hypothetical protein